MLSSLLPGIRQLRSPLVAGLIIMVALYLLLDQQISVLIQGNAADDGVKRVINLLGLPGRLAVGAIMAYLLGSVILQAIDQIRRMRERIFYRLLIKEFRAVGWGSIGIHDWTLWSRFVIPFSRTSLRRLGSRCNLDPDLIEAVQGVIRWGGGNRILVASKDLWLEYDRLRAEVELRRAITWSGPALLVALILSLSWPVWAAAIGITLFVTILAGIAIDGLFIHKDANSLYAYAVADRVVSTASLDALEAEGPGKSEPFHAGEGAQVKTTVVV